MTEERKKKTDDREQMTDSRELRLELVLFLSPLRSDTSSDLCHLSSVI
jgi:hypothetical protein